MFAASTLSQRTELATTEDVQVQMVDGLATPGTRVRDHPIAVRIETLLGSDRSRSQQERASDGGVTVIQLAHRLDVFSRNNEHVRWSRRLDVAECNDEIVLVDTLAWDVSSNDPTEDTLLITTSHWSLPSRFADSGSGSIMPELPEVETVRRTLDPLLRGRTVAGFTLGWHRTLEHPSLEGFNQAVIDGTVKEVSRRGKLIVIRLSGGGGITVHLRMTGELLFRPDASVERSSNREAYLRASFSFTDGSELLFYDTRKFGKIAYRSPDELASLESRLGVEPLVAEFTTESLTEILRSRRRQMKPLLLDQSVIAGLGNIYVDESLFRSRIHPLELSPDIDDARIESLHAAIVEVLSTAVALHGTTFRDYRSGLGQPGENQSRLQIYGLKPGTPCPDCGSPLERLVIGQRGSIFCPNCQPVAPTIDTLRR